MAGQPYPQQPYYPQQPGKKKGMSTCLIVFFAVAGAAIVIGIPLVVIAIAGVRKYIANAKTAEARNAVAQIARDAITAYEKDGSPVAGRAVRRLCPSASVSVPRSIALVSGKKYQSTSSEWATDQPKNAGFACLAFAMDAPQYYLYNYRARGASSAGDGFEAVANGDLDGDGTTSEFLLKGSIGGPDLVLVVAPTIDEKNAEE